MERKMSRKLFFALLYILPKVAVCFMREKKHRVLIVLHYSSYYDFLPRIRYPHRHGVYYITTVRGIQITYYRIRFIKIFTFSIF